VRSNSLETTRTHNLTYITVDRSLVDHVFVPYDRVDTLQQASKTGPNHKQACARIRSCHGVVQSYKNIPRT
jgi:hypothetical protein